MFEGVAQSLAFIAKKVEYRDNDLIVHLLTKRWGKLSALARGAKKSRKRFGASLSLFVLGEAHLKAPKKGQSLWTLERFDGVRDHSAAISMDLVKLTHASHVIELAHELWAIEQPESDLFALLHQTLEAIDKATDQDFSAALRLRHFEIKLLDHLGLDPMFDSCSVCNIPFRPSENWFFSFDSGGICCSKCSCHGNRPIASELVILIQAIRAGQAGIGYTPLLADVRALFLSILEHTMGKELKSWKFLLSLSSTGF